MRPELRALAVKRADAARHPQRVLVFTTSTWPWCSRAKAYLRQHGVPFREVDVSRDRGAARHLVLDRLLGLAG